MACALALCTRVCACVTVYHFESSNARVASGWGSDMVFLRAVVTQSSNNCGTLRTGVLLHIGKSDWLSKYNVVSKRCSSV